MIITQIMTDFPKSGHISGTHIKCDHYNNMVGIHT